MWQKSNEAYEANNNKDISKVSFFMQQLESQISKALENLLPDEILNLKVACICFDFSN